MRALHVDPMDDGDWLVRGTLEPDAAVDAVIRQEYFDYDDLAEVRASMILDCRPGLYRKLPCGKGSEGREAYGWFWQLYPVNRRGRGAFEGVWIRSGA